MSARRLTIFGAGPAGLIAALRARQLGAEVTVYTPCLVPDAAVFRLEVVPAQIVALLVEFGVHPGRLGVDRLFEARRTQWEGGAIESRGPPVAHIARPALEHALLEVALRAGVRIEVAARHDAAQDGLIDATGRTAISAGVRRKPRRPIVARTFALPVAGRERDMPFAIAAGPQGYAYRLGNRLGSSLGIVGRGALIGGDARESLERVRAFAPWLVDDIAAADCAPGAAGPASAQWSEGGGKTRRVGDAALARDALASQGLAIGLSDALAAVAPAPPATPPADARGSHFRQVAALIRRSPFAREPDWASYLAFLERAQAPAVAPSR